MTTSMLALTGLAAAIPFTARLWNVGGEGQLWFGAFAAVAIALTIPAGLPHWVFAPVVIITSMVAGGAYGFIPGLLKAWLNANEVIVSLMLTFAAIILGNYAVTILFRGGFGQQTETVPQNSALPTIWSGTLVNAGALLAVVAVVIAWVLMSRTALGFAIRAQGLNPEAARMSGVSIGRNIIVAFVIGGAFAGLAGGINVVGINDALISGFSGNIGFMGIAVALVARLNPLWVLPSAFLFAILRVGSNSLQAQTGLSASMAEVIVAIFIVLLLLFKVVRLQYAEAAT